MTFLGNAVAAAKQFEIDHGGTPLRDTDTGEEVFPDGTTRQFSDVANTYGIREAITPLDKLRGRRRYVALQLKHEQRDFHNFKQDCVNAIKTSGYQMSSPAPPANAKALLEAGAKRIQALQDELTAIDRELGQAPEEQARRAYLEEQNRRTLQGRNLANELMGINY